MRIRYVCECCDRVFYEGGVDGNQRRAGAKALTGANSHDIILQDNDAAGICLPALCEDCAGEIGVAGAQTPVFYGKPWLN